ncbi:hypothetical protein B5X24_HaOG206365 [Helicoverpa armigera]|nr:hypothetical protein B5X24_HaOG206365 [Helicoverpa armigera]
MIVQNTAGGLGRRAVPPASAALVCRHLNIRLQCEFMIALIIMSFLMAVAPCKTLVLSRIRLDWKPTPA